MADDDDNNYKLIRAVDPTKIKVPIKSRFANLTLSAKTKNISTELEKVKEKEQNLNKSESVTSNVMDRICELPTESSLSSRIFENPLCCSQSTTNGSAFYWQQADTQQNTQKDVNDELQEIQNQTEGMEPLQVTDEFTSPKHETTLCITISDTLSDYKDTITEPEPAISGYIHDVHDQARKPQTSANILCDEKISRINAFLRDVSFKREECAQHDRYIDPELEIHRQLAEADTESMSQTTGTTSQYVPIENKSPTQKTVQQITNGLNLIEINDGEAEANKSNAEYHSFNSKASSPADGIINSIIDESITVPETSSEVEILNDSQSPKKTNSEGISPSVGTTETTTTSVTPLHLNSINISAKFNIKIHISNAETTTSNSSVSSGGSSDDRKSSKPATKTNGKNTSQHQKSTLHVDSDGEEIVDQSSDVEEENFIVHAEDLLTQLYGNSWQTPNVIKTLKRSSGTGQGKSVSRTTRPEKITPKKQATKKSAAVKNESVLDDFSIFRSKIVNGNMDSTHVKTPTTVQPKKNRLDNIRNENRFRGTQSENRNPKFQERWRQLIDEDSDSDNESNNDKDSKDDTISIASTISGISSNSPTSNEIQEISPAKKGPEKDHQGCTPLENILRTCRSENKPKLESTRKPDIKTKRKLFVPNTGFEDEKTAEEIIKNVRSVSDDLLEDLENVYMPGTPVYDRVQDIKRQISGGGGDSIKKSDNKPIFKLPTTIKTPASKSSKTKTRLLDKFEETNATPSRKYSFLKSLEECASKSLCDPKALIYRDNYRTKKEELAQELYAMFIKKLFNESFSVPINWNKKLTTTAGRCLNRKRFGIRSSVIELSDKVLTSAERLRCTLMHELCHAATWILNEESGHGATWKKWASLANQTFPELPKIGICHSYEIEYKYTYKCTQCSAKSNAHSNSKKVENIRCSYCHGDIELFRNKKDKDGNIIATQIKEATGFAKYVKEHYKRYKRPDLKHADVMKILSNEFGNMKVSSNSN